MNDTYNEIRANAERWAGSAGWRMLGAPVRRALVAEAILTRLDVQDEKYVSAERVREMLGELRALMNSDPTLQD